MGKACSVRCAFLPLDTQTGQHQVTKVLQLAKPSLLLWADPHTEGGAGPLDPAALPDNCIPFQLQGAGLCLSSFQTALQTHSPANYKEELAGLYAEWQGLVANSPGLPFCYVLYTSGSTGAPAGVCGTEAGPPYIFPQAFQLEHLQDIIHVLQP